MPALALYQPDIPQNLGSILRLCACMGVECHVIEPCGFVLDDRKIGRVAMDYIDHVKWQRHVSWEQFKLYAGENRSRIVLLTTKTQAHYCDFTFRQNDILLLGRESAGVPQEVADYVDAAVTIPMAPQTRSLNIALAASMVLGEALRQIR
ncbi:MAG TPA: tRNA (cytidine(34)-2'-O)-methyltransferase [Rickettsiales bacterium]|nr:tRNA (cytidine(34)-2'-O)-methyltransferase [Rickettsiales bacterium]